MFISLTVKHIQTAVAAAGTVMLRRAPILRQKAHKWKWGGREKDNGGKREQEGGMRERREWERDRGERKKGEKGGRERRERERRE